MNVRERHRTLQKENNPFAFELGIRDALSNADPSSVRSTLTVTWIAGRQYRLPISEDSALLWIFGRGIHIDPQAIDYACYIFRTTQYTPKCTPTEAALGLDPPVSPDGLNETKQPTVNSDLQ
jgi:hypothetical protein